MLSMPLKLSVSLRLAALEPPSKSYVNRMVRAAFVQLSRNRGNSKAHEDRLKPCPYKYGRLNAARHLHSAA